MFVSSPQTMSSSVRLPKNCIKELEIFFFNFPKKGTYLGMPFNLEKIGSIDLSDLVRFHHETR